MTTETTTLPASLRDAVPVFVIGAPRSGTTMLGSMLGSHSQGLAIPESRFFSEMAPQDPDEIVSLSATIDSFVTDPKFGLWELDLAGRRPEGEGRYAEAVLWLVERFAEMKEKTGARFWIDHDPSHAPSTATLAAHFPTARFIHLVRDGRAVAASVIAANFGPNQIFDAARFWAYYVALGMAAERYLPPDRYVELRYEAIVRDPETALAPALALLGCDFEPGIISGGDYKVPTGLETLHPNVGAAPIAGRIDAWRKKLSDRELEIFEAHAEDLLTLLGYERVHPRPRQITAAEERALNLKRRFRRLRVLLGLVKKTKIGGGADRDGQEGVICGRMRQMHVERAISPDAALKAKAAPPMWGSGWRARFGADGQVRPTRPWRPTTPARARNSPPPTDRISTSASTAPTDTARQARRQFFAKAQP